MVNVDGGAREYVILASISAGDSKFYKLYRNSEGEVIIIEFGDGYVWHGRDLDAENAFSIH